MYEPGGYVKDISGGDRPEGQRDSDTLADNTPCCWMGPTRILRHNFFWPSGYTPLQCQLTLVINGRGACSGDHAWGQNFF